MAGPIKHELPEHWTELTAARAEKKKCMKEIQLIKVVCAAKCKKKTVSECKECHGRALDVMQRRYCEASEREWFKHRRAFINELGVLFAEAKEGKIDLPTVEARIESEKEAWYRWVLRTYPEFLTIAESGADQDALRAMLDDPDTTREQLVERVWEGVGKPPNWVAEMEEFTRKFEAAKHSKDEVKKLYFATFFKDQTEETLAQAQGIIQEYMSQDKPVLEDIVDKLVRDIRASKNSQPQRDTHIKRLDELRRAKTAFEQDRKRAKLQRREAQARGGSEELYDLPPCTACGKNVVAKAPFSCTTCLALAYLGDSARASTAIYCDQECVIKGRPGHDAMHECMAEDHCVGDEDEDMEGKSEEVICKRCVMAKTAQGVWCSEECARVNLPHHLLERHNSMQLVVDVKSMVEPFESLVSKIVKEQGSGALFKVFKPT